MIQDSPRGLNSLQVRCRLPLHSNFKRRHLDCCASGDRRTRTSADRRVSAVLTAPAALLVVAMVVFPSRRAVSATPTPTPIPCPETDLGSTVPVSVSGSTAGGGLEFFGSCGGVSALEKTFQFTAPATDTYTIDTFGSAYDTVLYVRDGGCFGAEKACNDDDLACDALQSKVTVSLVATQVIVIFVDGFGGQNGSFNLHINNSASAPTPCATGPTATFTPTPTSTPALGISGHVTYYGSALSVSGAQVQLQGPTPATTPSDSTGQYALSGLPSGNWQVVPGKAVDLNDRGRITAGDAVAVLQAVITGNLNQAQMLACDVNGSGTVTPVDAAFILQFVVGSITSLPVAQKCGSDWAFIPTAALSGQQLLQPQPTANPCQPGAIAFQPLGAQANGQDFSAVLFGDCNLNWQPTSAPTPTLSTALVAPPALRLGRLRRGRGGRLLLPVFAKTKSDDVHGLEMQLVYPAQLRPVALQPSRATPDALTAFHVAAPGFVRIALASAVPVPLRDGAPITVQFEARGPHNAISPMRALAVALDGQPAQVIEESGDAGG